MNKKGFTLIELLAVIVILAVIALIAVPQVLKILNQARESAAEDSAYGVIESAESYVATWMLKNQGDWNGATEFVCGTDTYKTVNGTKTATNKKACCVSGIAQPDAEEDCIDVKGTTPKDGTVELDVAGKAKIKSGANLHINNFYCRQDGEKVKCKTSYTSATTSD